MNMQSYKFRVTYSPLKRYFLLRNPFVINNDVKPCQLNIFEIIINSSGTRFVSNGYLSTFKMTLENYSEKNDGWDLGSPVYEKRLYGDKSLYIKYDYVIKDKTIILTSIDSNEELEKIG
ncbi:hypothetical protein [Francisella philomiragia]|uniref:hypothetical protein n=1 Tax=Francisella philomiragia TaxID=28110 RepID=UPI001904CA48|nr:hypothetical protein [Francisella philomiragia]MBK2270200.1 hypothetical protein [Francisella philomiragia]MBK2275864.1 hypothetical protein [Francisella philomiragia]MBK2305077.1 hypothetical protein [Francisella philomiragia]